MPTKRTKAQRAAAARKGWDTRRENIQLKLPDYGATGPQPKIPGKLAEQIDVGATLPIIRDALAGGIAKWPDEVFDVDPQGYQLMRTCPCVLGSVQKLGQRTAALDLVAVGEGDRAEAMQDIIDQANGVPEMVTWATWARLEGVRYMQLKKMASREGSEIMVVPDFIGGGRKKQNAGGSLQWDGTTIMQKQETTGVVHRKSAELPRNDFMIIRPGAGGNPEGDLELGVACWRIARSWTNASNNMDKFVDLHGVPMRIINRKLDKVRPDQVQGLLTSAATQLALQQHDQAFAMSSDDLISLLQPKGRPLQDMVEYAVYLEGVVDQLILLNTLTSNTSDSGPAGSSSVHLSEEDKAVLFNGHLIAQALNADLIPWIHRMNPDLPELGEDEQEVYYQFQPMGQREGEETAIAGEEDLSGEVQEVEVTPVKTDPKPEKKPEDVKLGLESDLRESGGEMVLSESGTDHTHTVTLNMNGDGTSSIDESEAAGPHSHEVKMNVVARGGSNNHKHRLAQPDVSLKHKRYHLETSAKD